MGFKMIFYSNIILLKGKFMLKKKLLAHQFVKYTLKCKSRAV